LSPIFTRPYREQHEHDRIIRLLQARYRRKHEVVINPGPDQHGAVTVGELPVYPDLLLYSQEPTQHLEATVEVETGESVHLLEARAEWGVFSQVPVPFILYVPATMLETARRIIDEQQWLVSEIWTYLPGMDQLRFVQVFKHPNPPVVVAPKMSARPRVKVTPAAPPAKATPTPASGPAAKSPVASEKASKVAPKVPGKPVATVSAKAAAKPPAKAPAKPAAKSVPRASASAAPSKPTASAKPAAKPAPRDAARQAASKAAPKPALKPALKTATKPAPRTAPPNKAVASARSGSKATGRASAPAAKKASAAAKKPAVVNRSASAKVAQG